ncbi:MULTISPECIES: hypothetical protein [unclassified Leptolyngbya]|uniref:hypothetical protein n=1 Tax=unclassified Leptolyngbya TaxID=2650499 RepID=UPI0016826B37|nr:MULTISPECIES: hypothetical protein [unclassified Leptolyngbya]MBD1912870.1 hypothetical protein [Leptolyngbya sp. FACHB-8]MBD2157481.1 hypothetical protein [Leptolyngbya sp. FACHB-16]
MSKASYPVPTKTEIEQALDILSSDERLTSAGYGLVGESSLSGHATLERWQEFRNQMLSIKDEVGLQEQLFTALCYLAKLTPTKAITDKQRSSYHWKHRAEKWGKAQGFCPYVSNGVFILAAKMKGFPTKGMGNPTIGILLKSSLALDSEA